MMVLFNDVPGYYEVCRNDYTLFREKDGKMIKSFEWEDKISGGDSITMSIILRRVFTKRERLPTYTCESCLFEDVPVNANQW
jgi:hypothetical protein